jgi:hypothetical protein
MAKRLDFPTLGNASFVEVNEHGRVGLMITQDGRTYFATKHQLTENTIRIIHTAIDAGLTAFWKFGHPGDSYLEGGANFNKGIHHIQFSKDHFSPWTFVIGKENKPPFPMAVTFNRKLEPVLNAAALSRGLNTQFKYQVIGGKNISVDIDYLAFALEVTAQDDIQSFLAAKNLRKTPVPRYPFYTREIDLQLDIEKALQARGFDVTREFLLKGKKVDILAKAGDRHLVIEIKPHSTGRPVFDQVDRYRELYSDSGAAGNCQIQAVLIARNFQEDLIQHIRNTCSSIKLVTYSLTSTKELEFTEHDNCHGVSVLDF